MPTYKAHLTRHDRIVVYDAAGSYLRSFGDYGSGEGQFVFSATPNSFGTSAPTHYTQVRCYDGALYVTSHNGVNGYRLQKWTLTGTLLWETRIVQDHRATLLAAHALEATPHVEAVTCPTLSPKRHAQVFGNVATVTGNVIVHGLIDSTVKSETLVLSGTSVIQSSNIWTNITSVELPAKTEDGEAVTLRVSDGYPMARPYDMTWTGAAVGLLTPLHAESVWVPDPWPFNYGHWEYQYAFGYTSAAHVSNNIILFNPATGATVNGFTPRLGIPFSGIYGHCSAVKQGSGAIWLICGGWGWGRSDAFATTGTHLGAVSWLGGDIGPGDCSDALSGASWPKYLYWSWGNPPYTLATRYYGGTGGWDGVQGWVVDNTLNATGHNTTAINDAVQQVLITGNRACSLLVTNGVVYPAPVSPAWAFPATWPAAGCSIAQSVTYTNQWNPSIANTVVASWRKWGLMSDDVEAVFIPCAGAVDDSGNVYIADINYTLEWEEIPDASTAKQLATLWDEWGHVEHCAYEVDNVIYYATAPLTGSSYTTISTVGTGRLPGLELGPDGRIHIGYQNPTTGVVIRKTSRDCGLTWS